MRRLVFLCQWLAIAPIGAAAAPALFQVDLRPYAAAGWFDPAVDRVEVRGDFNGWAGGQHPLAAEAGGGIWAGTFDLPAGDLAYKFVIVRSGGAPVWEDHVADRRWAVPAAGGAAPLVPFDGLAAAPAAGERVVGADLSFVPRLAALGASYRHDGIVTPLVPLLRAEGVNLARLRLWHAPSEPWHGLAATVSHAAELAAAGLDVMLDVHYSDTWADPDRQTPPAAWQGLPAAVLADSVAACTRAAVARFVAAGVVPRYVQLGNEIDGGMLWDEGRVGWPGSAWDTPERWSALAAMLQAAAAAVRAALPPGADTELVIHLSQGGDNARCRWFCDRLEAAGVDHDVIGLSYYPWWHGPLWQLDANVRDLGARYGRTVMVVETAYPWTLDGADATGNFVASPDDLQPGYPATPRGQLDFLRDVRRVVESAGGAGVICWEPAWLPAAGGPPNPWENLTLFDFTGAALPGLGFGAAAPGLSAVPPSLKTGGLRPDRPIRSDPRP